MAFLNVEKVRRMAQVASTAEHPLLSKIALDAAVRTAYVQGCVLAALIDDGKISEQERERVRRVGLSLRMPDDGIEECFDTVSSLPGGDEKERFLVEILELLKPDPVGRYFMADFENILQSNGEVAGEALELLDYIGATLFNDVNWRQKIAAAEEAAKRAEAARREAAEEARRRAEQRAAADRARREEAERRAKEQARRQEIESKIKAKTKEREDLNEMIMIVARVNQNHALRMIRDRNGMDRELEKLKAELKGLSA